MNSATPTTSTQPDTSAITLPDNIGHEAARKFKVEIGVRFLEHFSEQLYSSPQKAFEELISNGWDAGADYVDIRISDNLSAANATMCVLDNGSSMNEAGLMALWRIASSNKKKNPEFNGRRVIGKFGIGKLATYVLANKLTYICKANDGIIRRITMDYSDIGGESDEEDFISKKDLEVFEVTMAEVEQALQNVDHGATLIQLIKDGIPKPTDALAEDEFGAPKLNSARSAANTWTLAVLADLKPTGRNLKPGVLRRMLEAALPLGSEMAIKLNDSLLTSSKIDATVMAGCDWKIGPDLKIEELKLRSDENGNLIPADDDDTETDKSKKIEVLTIKSGIDTTGPTPIPYIELPEVGRVTGRVRLFKEPISGGKSEERGSSNGFHVNVLGRVVNQTDISFGEENLSHASWARFRMAVRADGLNDSITINREQFKSQRRLKIFSAFLRAVFNKARRIYDSDINAAMPNGGDVLVKSLGVLSLSPLRNVVSDVLKNRPMISGLFDEQGIADKPEKMKSWQENTAENIKAALEEVKYDKMGDESFVKFRISDNSIIVNKEHPFVQEHSRSRAEKELVRTIAMVNILTDVYAIDLGIKLPLLESIRSYRDQLMRFHSMQRRQSGIHIAKLLLKTQHDSANSKRLEVVLSDALRYLGFQVKDMAKPGEPEGVASAYGFSTRRLIPTKDNPNPPLYTFSFDAKASKHEVASTGNIKLDGIVQHRNRYNADYALVVAPDYSDGSLAIRCAEQRVTPMTAHDLGKLLEYTVEYGALSLDKLRELFTFHDYRDVTTWVNNLGTQLREKRPLTIDIFIKALRNLKGRVPNAVSADTIAYECREQLGAFTVSEEHVIALATGLEILVPDLVGVNNDKIIVNASADHVAAAIARQLENLRDDSPINWQ